MTDLRKAAEMALNAMLDIPMAERPKAQVQAIQALRQALTQPDEVLVEREACAKVADQWDTAITDKVAEAIRARSEKPPVKTYCGGKPNYCTPEVTPDVDAVNMSQERVDETAKGEQEPYGYVWTSLRDGMEVRFSRMPPNKFYNPQDIKPVYTAPPKREWVGLTKEDMPVGDNPIFDTDEFAFGAAWAQAKLKEKNS